MTALPIIETQSGDVSAYIPTNVISRQLSCFLHPAIVTWALFLQHNYTYFSFFPPQLLTPKRA